MATNDECDVMGQCPACKKKFVINHGEIHYIGGLFALKTAGDLYQCRCCHLFFRHPYLSESMLKKAYESIDIGSWFYHDREDFRLARRVIDLACEKGDILDIGCFRGDFLYSLPKKHAYYGIEPSPDAREDAKAKGICLIAETIQELDNNDMKFDVITMLDVIEHLPDPYAALQKVTKSLKPKGVLIIATGNTNALPWRIMRLNYWYYFSEHVSFFNKKWFQWICKKMNLEILQVQKFSHFDKSIFIRLRQLLEAAVYALLNSCNSQKIFYRILIKIYPFNRAKTWKEAPKTNAWKDHILVVLRKNS